MPPAKPETRFSRAPASLKLTFDPTRQTAAGFPLKGLLVKASITNNERTLLSSAILFLIFTLSLPVRERAKKCTETSRRSDAHLACVAGGIVY